MDVQAENLCGADQIAARPRFLPRVDSADKHRRRIGPRDIKVFGPVLEHETQAKPASRETVAVPPTTVPSESVTVSSVLPSVAVTVKVLAVQVFDLNDSFLYTAYANFLSGSFVFHGQNGKPLK
jgi:hypothetical protein